MTTPNPLADGAVNVPRERPTEPATDWGFDSAGIGDNFQATDQPTIDRHIV